MQYGRSIPFDTQQQAEAHAKMLKASSDQYAPLYEVQVARSGQQWVVTYYRGSLD